MFDNWSLQTFMIWSKLDFEREVRRQLIEIESIRKRIPADSEAHARIDRLEASHQHLLKKLDELFPGGQSSAPPPKGDRLRADEDLTGLVGAGAREIVEKESLRRVAGELSRAPAGRVNAPRGLLSPGPEVSGSQRGEEPGQHALDPGSRSLDPGARCGGCGRLLLPALLGGETLVRAADGWRHEPCAGDHPGEEFRKPGVLN